MPVSDDVKMLGNMVKAMKDAPSDPLTPLIEEYLRKRKMPKYRDRLLDEFLLDLRDRPRPPGRLSPSSICGCERQAAFRFLGAPTNKKFDMGTELVFLDGHWRHHKWGVVFREMERVLGSDRLRVVDIELGVSIPELYIEGSLDMEIEVKDGKKWLSIIVDFKGANDYAFRKTYNERSPNPTYLKQLRTYVRARGKKRGILLYENKDKNGFFCFPIKVNDRLWGEIEAWCLRVIRKMEKRKLPEKHPECQSGRFLYGKCDYAELCFGKTGDKQVEKQVYLNFPGVREQWDKTHRE